MHVCKRGEKKKKKRRKGEARVGFEGKQRTRGMRTGREAHAASPWPGAPCPLDKSCFTIPWGWPGGPETHCTLRGWRWAAGGGTAGLSCGGGTVDGAGRAVRSQPNRSTAPCSPATPGGSLAGPTPLAEEVSALLCTPKAPAKGGGEFPWGALHERRGMSSPMVAATPSVCQAPAETAV